MSSNMRIVTAFDIMSSRYQVRIEIDDKYYCFTQAQSCSLHMPYPAVKMKGEQVKEFIDWVHTFYHKPE